MTVVAPTGTDLAQFLTILPTLTGQINADIAAVGASSQAAPRLTAGTDLNDLDTPRTDWVTATIDSIANVPPGEVAGFVRTFWQSTTNRVQVWYTSGLSTNVWIRFRGSSGWSAWKRMDAQYAIDTAAAYTDAAVAAATPGTGNKLVPLALTVGGSSATYGTTSAGVRIPLDYAPTISRWRVHVRNINPRFGLNNAGSISLTGLWVGKHDGAGNFTGTPTQISAATSTPSDGSDWVSPWVNSPIGGNTSFLLAYGFSAGSATQSVIGGGWTVASSSDAINNAATKAAVTTMPLDVWLEAEVTSGTPVIAGVGDSLMSGVGSTLPVHDSTVSQYARANGALPVHYSASGDAANASTDATAYKWTRWKSLAKPDAALVGMGSNDVFGGDALATLQANYQTLLGVVSSVVSKNIYAATLMPRDAVTGTQETTRKSFNTWLKSGVLPSVRDVFDLVPGVSADDETLTAALTADGIHLTTAGYAVNRDAISRSIAPLPTPPSPLSTWRAALAGSESAPARVVCFGDSRTEGTGTTDVSLRWVTQLQKFWRQQNGTTGALFPFIPTYPQTTAPGFPVTRSGTVNQDTTYGFGWRTGRLQDNTSTVTFSWTGTSAKLMYVRASSTAIMRISVDGGTAVVVDTNSAAGGASNAATWSTGPLTRGAHTITVTRDPATTNSAWYVYLQGCLTWDGDENAGVRIVDAGYHGSSSTFFTSTRNTTAAAAVKALGNVSLVTIAMGTNDTIGPTAPATYRANIEGLIAALRTAGGFSGSVALINLVKPNTVTDAVYAPFAEQMAAIAASDPMVTFIDMRREQPDTPTPYTDIAGQGLFNDNIHEGNYGHALVAGKLAKLLG